MKQETLLPATQALLRSTIQFERHQGKILIRYRDPQGNTWQQTFTDPEQAHNFILDCAQNLRAQLQAQTKKDNQK